MKKLALLFLALLLAGCSGVRVVGTMDTRFGTVVMDQNGNVSLALKPVVLHEK